MRIQDETRLSSNKMTKKKMKIRTHARLLKKLFPNIGKTFNIKNHGMKNINNDETVSVIVPFYGVEPFIGKCIDSLLHQTHNNLEILCIDDCSPDNSLEIVQAYADKDDRIKIIRHDANLGLGGARNTGIKNACGKYICFVDSDDYISKNFVEMLYNTIRKDNSDIALCGFWMFNYKGERIECHTEYKNETLTIDHRESNVIQITKKYAGATWLKMYKRKLLIENNILQPEKSYYEDVVFWLKCVFYSTRISTLSDRLYYYRFRSNSIMSTLSHKHIDDRIIYIQEIDKFIQDNILISSKAGTSKIINDAQSYIQDHIDYGWTLIKKTRDENKTEIASYYDKCLSELVIDCI